MSYAIAGYVLTALILLAYAVRVILRGRSLARTLPPSERTWK